MLLCFFFFFFNDTATTEIYTLSLHDALPISAGSRLHGVADEGVPFRAIAEAIGRGLGLPAVSITAEDAAQHLGREDRKSTRLNSSHTVISYAVFCLKKKKKAKRQTME